MLYTRHGALTHSVREVSRDRMFPLPHAPNQLPNQLVYETPAVLATRRIFRAGSTSTKMNMSSAPDVPVVHFRKNWYQSLSFTEIYHWRVVPKNFRKKGAPYSITI